MSQVENLLSNLRWVPKDKEERLAFLDRQEAHHNLTGHNITREHASLPHIEKINGWHENTMLALGHRSYQIHWRVLPEYEGYIAFFHAEKVYNQANVKPLALHFRKIADVLTPETVKERLWRYRVLNIDGKESRIRVPFFQPSDATWSGQWDVTTRPQQPFEDGVWHASTEKVLRG
eukprot:2098451-Rhodomonas_salina.1